MRLLQAAPRRSVRVQRHLAVALADQLELRHQRLRVLLEVAAVSLVDGQGIREFHFQRIAVHAIDQEFVMQVGPVASPVMPR